MVRAQGGDDSWVADIASTTGHHVAKFTHAVRAPRDGVISAFSPACEIGMVAVALGAGRLLASDTVDPAAGVYMYSPFFNVSSLCFNALTLVCRPLVGSTKSARA